MDPTRRATLVLAPVAKMLFGRPVRIALAAWIRARHGQSFIQTEAQNAMSLLGFAHSATRAELLVFVETEMLQSVPDANRVFFTERESPFWAAFDAIAEALEKSELSTASGLSVTNT